MDRLQGEEYRLIEIINLRQDFEGAFDDIEITADLENNEAPWQESVNWWKNAWNGFLGLFGIEPEPDKHLLNAEGEMALAKKSAGDAAELEDLERAIDEKEGDEKEDSSEEGRKEDEKTGDETDDSEAKESDSKDEDTAEDGVDPAAEASEEPVIDTETYKPIPTYLFAPGPWHSRQTHFYSISYTLWRGKMSLCLIRF